MKKSLSREQTGDSRASTPEAGLRVARVTVPLDRPTSRRAAASPAGRTLEPPFATRPSRRLRPGTCLRQGFGKAGVTRFGARKPLDAVHQDRNTSPLAGPGPIEFVIPMKQGLPGKPG